MIILKQNQITSNYAFNSRQPAMEMLRLTNRPHKIFSESNGFLCYNNGRGEQT